MTGKSDGAESLKTYMDYLALAESGSTPGQKPAEPIADEAAEALRAALDLGDGESPLPV